MIPTKLQVISLLANIQGRVFNVNEGSCKAASLWRLTSAKWTQCIDTTMPPCLQEENTVTLLDKKEKDRITNISFTQK